MKYIISTILLLSSYFAIGQVDRTFWFVAPEVSVHGNSFLDRPIEFIFSAKSQSATIVVSMPAEPLFIPITVNVAANSTQSLNLTNFIDIIETKPPNTILKSGVLIESTNDIAVYYNVVTGGPGGNGNSPEIFVLKGHNALGTSFVIPSQNYVENHASYNPFPTNSFDIVATENNTSVTITSPKDLVGRPTGNGAFTILLQKGETYSAAGVSNLAADHLAGAFVVSNKPIAITVKDDLLYSPIYGVCADLTGDQIVPANKLGTAYIAMPTYLSIPGDQIFITATENNTQIFEGQNAVAITTINRGVTYRMPVPTQGIFITTSQPVAVWQLAGHGCEFGATMLPSIECTGSTQVSYVRSSDFQLKLNLLVEAGHQGDFRINNQPINAASFNAVQGTNNAWMFARIDLPTNTYPQNTLISVENTTSKFHMAMTDVTTGGASYAYYSDYSQGRVVNKDMQTDYCVGDSIKFQINGLNGTNARWTGPNNFSSNNPNPIIPNAIVSNTGWYYVSGSYSDCGLFDSIYIAVKPNVPLVLQVTDTAICEFDSITLRAVTTDSILWSLNSPYRLLPANAIKVKLTNSGWVKAIPENKANCLLPDSLFVTVDHYPKLNIKASDLIVSCINPYTIITADGAKNYEWYNANRQLINNTDSINYLVNNKEYIYIKGYNNNAQCFTLDSLLLDINVNTINFIPNAFSPNEDGLNDKFGVHLSCDVERYQLSIFNRYGERVFYSVHVEDEWDGLHKNQMCDVGVYYYHLQYRHRLQGGDNIVLKGEIHLIR